MPITKTPASLLEYVENGLPLDCSPGVSLSSLQEVLAIGEDQVVRADDIRKILIGDTGTPPPLLDPRGVVIRGAWIRDELDLDGVNTTVGLRLTGCRLDGLTLCDANLRWLSLNLCVLPAVKADRAQLGALTLDRCLLTRDGPEESLSLVSVHLATGLRLSGTRFENRSGPAVMARGINVGADAFLDGVMAAAGSAGPEGAVCLSGATITGQLALRDATLGNPTGPALIADSLTAGNVLLDQGFTASGSGPLGTVRLPAAKIGGMLSLDGADLTNPDGPALVADSLTVQANATFRTVPGDAASSRPERRFTATGAGEHGTVSLRDATVSGQLRLDDAQVTCNRPAAGEPAAPGDAGAGAAVCLSGATVGGDLVLRGANLTSHCGPALAADYLTAKGDAFRCEEPGQGFTAEGTGDGGAVSLAGATITGQLALRDTTLTNTTTGPALIADSLTAGSVLLDQGFTATGSGDQGTVRLADAGIGKWLVCSGQAVNAGAPALVLARAKVGRLTLGLSFASNGDGKADGLHDFDGLTYTEPPRLLSRQTLTPGGKPGIPRPVEVPDSEQVREWITCLKWRSAYAPQPYQTLAAAYQALGDDAGARHLYIAQRDDARDRGRLGPLSKAGQSCLRKLIGYGYHSIQALGWLAALFAVTALIAVIALGPNKLIVPTSTTKPPTAECSVTGRIGYAIEIAFPIVNLNSGTEQQCDVPATGAEWWVVALGWIVRAIAATLLAFYVAGLAGITRSS